MSYSRRWNDLRKQPLQPLDEDEAKRMHEKAEPYVAYVHDVDGRPDAVVELALFSPSVGVYFLDDRRQRSTYYAFTSDGAGNLLLDEFGWRSFGPDGQITMSERHRFSPDGVVSVTRSDFSTKEEKRWEEKLEDLSKLFEPIPAFGDYESITRYER